MATIGTLFPPSSTSGISTASQAASTTATSSTSLGNQSTFLQLLVAQLQHQDPSQPVDGTTFVTELATFSNLQANLGTKTDLDAISKQYLGTTPTAASTTSSTSANVGAVSSTSASGN